MKKANRILVGNKWRVPTHLIAITQAMDNGVRVHDIMYAFKKLEDEVFQIMFDQRQETVPINNVKVLKTLK